MIILGIVWIVIAIFLSLSFSYDWVENVPVPLVFLGFAAWMLGNLTVLCWVVPRL